MKKLASIILAIMFVFSAVCACTPTVPAVPGGEGGEIQPETQQYTVTFHYDNNVTTLVTTGKIPKKTISKPGMVFVGWSTDPNDASKLLSLPTVIDKDTHLYAVHKEVEVPDIETYKITFHYDGQKKTQVTIGKVSNMDITVEGKKLIGWTDNPDEPFKIITFPFTADRDMDLYAVFDTDFQNQLPELKITTYGAISNTDDYTKAIFTVSGTKEEYEFEDVSGGIRLRGNSTRGMPKKPYRIKFDYKRSMFGEPKHKSWVLLADYLDASLVRNYSAHYFARQLDGLDAKSCAYHVNLYLNGTYKGVYLLCDQTEEQKDTRVPIEIDNLTEDMVEVPFLVVKNQTRAPSQSKYPYDWFEHGVWTWSIKYPENPTYAQNQYIKNQIASMEDALKQGNTDYVNAGLDLDSFFDFYLVNEFFFNRDALQLSVYVYKPLGGKLTFGPVWDFDFCLGHNYTGIPTVERNLSRTTRNFFTEEYKNCWMYSAYKIPEYKQAYQARWPLARQAAVNTLNHIKEYKKVITPAATLNCNLWYGDYVEGGSKGYVPERENLFEDQYQYVIDWIDLRIKYFDEEYV